MIVILISTIVLLLAILIDQPRRRVSKLVRHLPGPTEYPLFGSKYALFPNKITDIVALSEEICTGPIAKLFFGPRLVLIISDPAAFETILNAKSCLERPYLFEFIHLDNGLTASKYHFWRPLRRGLNVAFSQPVVNGLIPMFDEHFKEMITKMEGLVNQGEFDVQKCANKALFKSICHTIVEEVVEDGFSEADMEELEDIICKRILNGLIHLNFIYERTNLCKREVEIRDNMAKVLTKILEKKKRDISTDNITDTKLFLERLLLMKINGTRLKDSQIIENMVNLLIGGFETSASTLAYAALAIAMHPEVQHTLQVEVDKVFPKNEPLDFNHDSLKKLTYMDCVINETLRLFPPIPFSARENTEEVTVNQTVIPARTIIGLNIFQLHRSVNVWGENSNTFDPKRFTPENMNKRHPYSFLPFSAGSRNCIGNRYGLTAIKIGLVHLVRNFEFTTNLKLQDLKFKFSITLKLLNGHLVQIKKRS